MEDLINPRSVKKGDVILVSREVEVTRDGAHAAFNGPNGSLAIDYIESGVSGRIIISPDTKVQLLEREIKHPELPTKGGSVLRVTSRAGFGIWLLQRHGTWISAAGVKMSPSEFLDFISRGADIGRTFEVVA
ncbi:hypothetical protein ISF9_045 [Microbacterium phage vB_MoxS-ISF9]|uniref:Uncharacterized protein n=1 Tax=Microbacterium phage vB_MoxS-ISF9 TaxID=1458670 RepID=W8NNK5_9CAUD|nr:hypothetical protein ISF9_045 [Microbacterium phage vB_MoxS-ISF9]AHL18515.1 hypothetical protein ISF9_045 [Microbacterium phage vB_MoxS-ISF9]